MHENLVSLLAGIGIIAILCQWFAWWVKLPAILFLLLAGILAGPITGWLNPDEVFGRLLFPIVSLSVAVILFEGSLTLKFAEIRGLEKVVRRLVTSGILVTWLVITLATKWLLPFSWELACLFGAVTVVTGPTVIVPLLRTVRPNAKVANILRWEGIVIDPIGALLAVLVFEFILSGQDGSVFSHTIVSFGKTIGVGLIVGAAAGHLLGTILRRHWLPEYLHNVATLTIVFGVFALSNEFQEESGLLTVTIMGVWLANMKQVPVDNILDFKESLSVLLISGLFIILAARIDFSLFTELGWGALGVFMAIQFVARPMKVMVSTFGSSLNWRERAVLAWIAPRGIVAAAVTALFAIRLQEQGYDGAAYLVPLVFMVIIGTVVLQSTTAGWIARWLKVADPEARGYLIVGANPVARAIAKALREKDYNTLLTDTSWDNIRTARMEGLQAYYGNAVSEHADRALDLIGIGKMLALTPVDELNALACVRYRAEFGLGSIYALPSTIAEEKKTKAKLLFPQGTNYLFAEEISFSKLASLISLGAEIRTTNITEAFSYDDYLKKYHHNAVPLFAINPRGKLLPFIVNNALTPSAGWSVISLITPEIKSTLSDADCATR